MSVKLDPAGFYRRVPLAPHQLRQRVTPTEDAIVLCHLGVARLPRQEWKLAIDGLVERPTVLSFDDLLRYPKVEIASVHECAGSPLQPFEPTRRVCNVLWGGARLADLLAKCRPTAEAKFLWSYGADRGEFSGVTVDAYVKDLPLERVAADVVIAYEMNGAPLRDEHGHPARLVVPGFYGTNSVKWLTRMTLADRRAESPFTTRWYNDPVLDRSGQPTGGTTPVWAIAPESLIVSPSPETTMPSSERTEIWGWAWAEDGITSVDVSTNGGASWQAAEVEPRCGRQWQRFSLTWSPDSVGRATLCSRATSNGGARQPLSSARNAVYRVPVQVV